MRYFFPFLLQMVFWARKHDMAFLKDNKQLPMPQIKLDMWFEYMQLGWDAFWIIKNNYHATSLASRLIQADISTFLQEHKQMQAPTEYHEAWFAPLKISFLLEMFKLASDFFGAYYLHVWFRATCNIALLISYFSLPCIKAKNVAWAKWEVIQKAFFFLQAECEFLWKDFCYFSDCQINWNVKNSLKWQLKKTHLF